jgi:hypothetical protein
VPKNQINLNEVAPPLVSGGVSVDIESEVEFNFAIKVCLDYIFRRRAKNKNERTIDKPID